MTCYIPTVVGAVLDTPIPLQADTVIQPAMGPYNNSTGQSEAVLRTGIDPNNFFANVFPQSDNPVVVDAAMAGDGSVRAPVGTVTVAGRK
jgi:hypothetical protein